MRSIAFEHFEILDNVRLSNIYDYMLFLKHLNNLMHGYKFMYDKVTGTYTRYKLYANY